MGAPGQFRGSTVVLICWISWSLVGCTLFWVRPAVGQRSATGDILGMDPVFDLVPKQESFETPEASWQERGGDAPHRPVVRQRTREQPHSGSWCELLELYAGNGTSVYVGHQIPQARVIDELQPSLWLRSRQEGLQLFVRVVLPHTVDPRTNRPLETLLAGDLYTTPGRWQRLTVQHPQTALQQQRPGLQWRLGTQRVLNIRGAYVTEVWLNIYGGDGLTRVWVDDLEVKGVVIRTNPETDALFPATPQATSSSEGSSPGGPTSLADTPPSGKVLSDASEFSQASAGQISEGIPEQIPEPVPAPSVFSPTEQVRPSAPVAVQNGVLEVHGRPLLVRAIRHQGEPLEFLGNLGFNAVFLDQTPPLALLAEARQAGLWVICPPPLPAGWQHQSSEFVPRPVESDWDVVLLWHLGERLRGEDLSLTKRMAAYVRHLDSRRGRPLLAAPQEQLRAYSRQVDVLMDTRTTLLTTRSLADHAQRLSRQPDLARPGTPFWAKVATEPPRELTAQWDALGGTDPLAYTASVDQLRVATYTALAAGMRGLLFESHTPLHRTDPGTLARARGLELLNLELRLAAPWLASGRLGPVAGTTPEQGNVRSSDVGISRARSFARRLPETLRDPSEMGARGRQPLLLQASDPDVEATIFSARHTRLIVVRWCGPEAQFVPGGPRHARISFVLPGVPESSGVYELTAVGLRPLRRDRVAGGVEVTLEDFHLSALVLVTDDLSVLKRFQQRLQAGRQRAAWLARLLARQRLEQVAVGVVSLTEPSRALAGADVWLQAGQKELTSAEAAIRDGRLSEGFQAATRALRPLRVLARVAWQSQLRSPLPTPQNPPFGPLSGPMASPLGVSFSCLADHTRLRDQLRKARFGPNLLVGGDCEDFEVLVRQGWTQQQGSEPSIEGDAFLDGAEGFSGSGALRLVAGSKTAAAGQNASSGRQSSLWLESPPVALTTAELPLSAGTLVQISGWVKVPRALVGSVDGFEVFDSIGGPNLALRFAHQEGWRSFSYLRVAPRDQTIAITLRLTGLGEVLVDDLALRVVEFPPVQETLPPLESDSDSAPDFEELPVPVFEELPALEEGPLDGSGMFPPTQVPNEADAPKEREDPLRPGSPALPQPIEELPLGEDSSPKRFS